MFIINWLKVASRGWMKFLLILLALLLIEAAVFLKYGFLLFGVFFIILLIYFRLTMDKIIYALGIIILFAGLFGSYLGIPGNENLFLFRILIPIHLILLCVSHPPILERVYHVRAFFILFLLFIMSMLMTFFWTPSFSESFRYLYFLFEWLYILFLCVYSFPGKPELRTFSNLMVVFYMMMLALGCFESLTGYHLPQSGSLYYLTTTSKFQPTGLQFNTNDFASVLTIFFPLVIIQVLKYPRKNIRVIVAGIIIMATVFLTIMTYSRMAMLVLGIQLLLLLFSWVKSYIFLILYALLTGFLFISTFYNFSALSRLEQIISTSFTDKGTSTLERLQMYQASWKFIQESHYLGLGAGILPVKLDNYMYGFERLSDNYFAPHNYWLEAFANGGMIAILCITSFFSYYFYASIRYWVKQACKAEASVPLLIGVAFVGASIALSSTIDKRHLAIGIGIGISILNIYFFKKRKCQTYDDC
ncbi:O-antigen ligase family protein [Listeria fleischmannii]|uniref:O-antigen ligase family protein n=2 Tax=Listeria fleischmannii TaxID=1069827 RepID=UPI0021AB818D|nr:O-antigen ligase family protein [Listeria fleischmannii]